MSSEDRNGRNSQNLIWQTRPSFTLSPAKFVRTAICLDLDYDDKLDVASTRINKLLDEIKAEVEQQTESSNMPARLAAAHEDVKQLVEKLAATSDVANLTNFEKFPVQRSETDESWGREVTVERISNRRSSSPNNRLPRDEKIDRHKRSHDSN